MCIRDRLRGRGKHGQPPPGKEMHVRWPVAFGPAFKLVGTTPSTCTVARTLVCFTACAARRSQHLGPEQGGPRSHTIFNFRYSIPALISLAKTFPCRDVRNSSFPVPATILRLSVRRCQRAHRPGSQRPAFSIDSTVLSSCMWRSCARITSPKPTCYHTIAVRLIFFVRLQWSDRWITSYRPLSRS